MSTRCQIEFKHITRFENKKKPLIERRTIYRHSDGYPEGESGVVADLKKFLKWNNGRNDDIEYQTANFIYWSKRWYEELYFNKDLKGKIETLKLHWFDNTDDTLGCGFGICENNEFHGDIEYFYEVITELFVTTPFENHVNNTKVLVYKIEQKDYNKPITRKDLKLINTITIKEATK